MSKNKESKIKLEIFIKAKEKLLNIFPQVSKKAFYVSDFKTSKVFPPGETNIYESVVVELTKTPLMLRAYRKSKEKSAVLYKIDEFNAQTKKWRAAHKKIEGHRIEHNITDDMMKRNKMTVDFISDDNGNLKPNIQRDGMVKAYINFPDPTEELKRSMIKKS